jgi:hypothetical protein
MDSVDLYPLLAGDWDIDWNSRKSRRKHASAARLRNEDLSWPQAFNHLLDKDEYNAAITR